jgi:two-component system cell cycle response regulator
MLPNGAIKTAQRVLMIESCPTDRQLLRNWLAAERIETHEATDIISGLAACSKVHPNLILLQLRLPTWDGFEVIRRLKGDPRTLSIPVIFLAGAATTSEKAKGIDMGAVDFVSKPFDPVELMARLQSALRTKAYLDLLEQRAHIDGLTELSNRLALQERLPLMWETCAKNGQPLAVLIADLDNFKKINDLHGHAAGDEVLRQAAATLRATARESDFIARYGGEEFVVVAPDCDVAGAILLAERFRAAVADLRIGFRAASIRVTSSVGIAMAGTETMKSAFDAIDRADQALYRAKAAGRDAVWMWDPAKNAAIPTGLAQFDSTMLALLLDGQPSSAGAKAGPHLHVKTPVASGGRHDRP